MIKYEFILFHFIPTSNTHMKNKLLSVNHQKGEHLVMNDALFLKVI